MRQLLVNFFLAGLVDLARGEVPVVLAALDVWSKLSPEQQRSSLRFEAAADGEPEVAEADAAAAGPDAEASAGDDGSPAAEGAAASAHGAAGGAAASVLSAEESAALSGAIASFKAQGWVSALDLPGGALVVDLFDKLSVWQYLRAVTALLGLYLVRFGITESKLQEDVALLYHSTSEALASFDRNAAIAAASDAGASGAASEASDVAAARVRTLLTPIVDFKLSLASMRKHCCLIGCCAAPLQKRSPTGSTCCTQKMHPQCPTGRCGHHCDGCTVHTKKKKVAAAEQPAAPVALPPTEQPAVLPSGLPAAQPAAPPPPAMLPHAGGQRLRRVERLSSPVALRATARSQPVGGPGLDATRAVTGKRRPRGPAKATQPRISADDGASFMFPATGGARWLIEPSDMARCAHVVRHTYAAPSHSDRNRRPAIRISGTV